MNASFKARDEEHENIFWRTNKGKYEYKYIGIRYKYRYKYKYFR